MDRAIADATGKGLDTTIRDGMVGTCRRYAELMRLEDEQHADNRRSQVYSPDRRMVARAEQEQRESGRQRPRRVA